MRYKKSHQVTVLILGALVVILTLAVTDGACAADYRHPQRDYLCLQPCSWRQQRANTSCSQRAGVRRGRPELSWRHLPDYG